MRMGDIKEATYVLPNCFSERIIEQTPVPECSPEAWIHLSVLSYQDIDGEWHDEARDEEVGHGEGDDEEVGDVLQELLPTHRQDDQHVPEDHHNAQLKF